MKRIVSFITFFVLGLIAVAFAAKNDVSVELHYYLGSVAAPLSLLLVISLGIGALLGVFACSGVILKLKRETMRLQKSVKVAEKEVTNLRALPIKDQH